MTGVSWWKNGRGECGQLGGACCNGRRDMGGGVEGKHSPERGFELLFFDIKGGKVDLLS